MPTSTARLTAIAAIAVALALVAVFSQPSANFAQSPPAEQPVIYLVGHPEPVQEARYLLDEIGIDGRAATPPSQDDLVFFVVSAVDGPMPATREGIQNTGVKSFRQAAILLVHADRNTDPELRQLIVAEMRELLQASGFRRPGGYAIFTDDDANFRFIAHGFVCME